VTRHTLDKSEILAHDGDDVRAPQGGLLS
jgi:hypothetical protein